MTLETRRLLLRPWTQDDAPALYEYAKDPRVGPSAGWPPHDSVETSREVIRTVLSEPETYALVLRESGRPIGSIGLKTGGATDLTEARDEGELGFWLGVPYWGQGLVPEAAEELLRHAFEDLLMQAVWCAYYDGNEKSRRTQEKCGFLYHHREESVDVPLLGVRRTAHVSRLTRQQWAARRQSR